MKLPVRCMLRKVNRAYYGHSRKGDHKPMDKQQSANPLFTPPKQKKKRMGKSPVQH